MWIVPNTHPLYSAFAQGMVGSKEELNELSEQLESSLMWRSKPSLLRTWLTRWNRFKWFQHLCGRMLKPSLTSYFEELLISSQVVTPVSHSVQRVNGWVQKILDTYGLTSDVLSKLSDRGCVSSKTLKDIYRSDSPQYLAIWKKTVTQHRGEYSQRLKSAHHTREKECLSWPTVTSREWKGSGNASMRKDGKDRLDTLDAVVKHGHRDQTKNNTNGKNHERSENWLTLRSTEVVESYDNYRKRMIKSGNPKNVGKVRPANLTMQVNTENWPTPDCSDRRSKNSKQQGLSNQVQTENWRTPAACDGDGGVKTLLSIQGDPAPKIKLRDHVNHTIGSESKRKLNPSWVEQLMGLPVNHTQLTGVTDPNENRIDRLRLLGNGVVPQTAEKAFRTLLQKETNQ